MKNLSDFNFTNKKFKKIRQREKRLICISTITHPPIMIGGIQILAEQDSGIDFAYKRTAGLCNIAPVFQIAIRAKGGLQNAHDFSPASNRNIPLDHRAKPPFISSKLSFSRSESDYRSDSQSDQEVKI